MGVLVLVIVIWWFVHSIFGFLMIIWCSTAAAGHTKVAGNPDSYAWLEAINTPVNIYMRPGMYTGPTVQVKPNFYIVVAK